MKNLATGSAELVVVGGFASTAGPVGCVIRDSPSWLLWSQQLHLLKYHQPLCEMSARTKDVAATARK